MSALDDMRFALYSICFFNFTYTLPNTYLYGILAVTSFTAFLLILYEVDSF